MDFWMIAQAPEEVSNLSSYLLNSSALQVSLLSALLNGYLTFIQIATPLKDEAVLKFLQEALPQESLPQETPFYMLVLSNRMVITIIYHHI